MHDHEQPQHGSDDPRPDAELVVIAAAGRPGAAAAFTALYERHKRFVFRSALRFTGRDRELAADVVQETFAAFAEQLDRYEPRARLSTYLYAIARNQAIRLARRQARAIPALRLLDDDPSPAPAVPDTGPEGIDPRLAGAIAELSAPIREVLILRVFEGLATRETAEALGIPTGTVKTRLKSALDRLRLDPRAGEVLRGIEPPAATERAGASEPKPAAAPFTEGPGTPVSRTHSDPSQP